MSWLRAIFGVRGWPTGKADCARRVIAAPACRLWPLAGPSGAGARKPAQQSALVCCFRAAPEPRQRRAQRIKARGVGILVVLYEAPDGRGDRGQLVGGEVN